MKCEFTGCKHQAKWACRKLWIQTGAPKGVIHTCDKHKPDAEKRPESLRHLPFFYDVQPMEEDEK
jgi:hypothetical protein